MSRKQARERAEGFEAVYEGPEVLSGLLAEAGSPYTAEEVAGHFRDAQASGEPRGDVIPSLFPDEPRFPTPSHARRLYSNLFGLWERVASGQGSEDTEAVEVVEPPAPPPERGSLDGRVLTPAFVEAAWRWLETAPERESSRLRDRFSNTQPDLETWLGDVELPDTGGLAAQDLAFEAWAMMDRAFDERLGAVDWSELRDLEAEPPSLESVQPALAEYVAEQLDNLEDEAEKFGAAERAQVERVLAAVGAALTRKVAED